MSDPQHRALVETYYEKFIGDHNPTTADRLCSGDLFYRSPVAMAHDLATFKRVMGELFRGFPDLRYDVDFIIVADSRAMSRLTMRGTFRRPYLDAAPTQRKIALPAVKIFRFENGTIADIETFFDSHVLLEQLGKSLPVTRV